MSIIHACYRIIQEAQPRFWIIENVRGAIRWLKPLLGQWKSRHGPFFLWGNFPDLGSVDLSGMRPKQAYSSSQSAERAKIPYAISAAVADAVERSLQFEQIVAWPEG